MRAVGFWGLGLGLTVTVTWFGTRLNPVGSQRGSWDIRVDMVLQAMDADVHIIGISSQAAGHR